MKKISLITATLALVMVLSSCGGNARPFDYGTLEGTKYSNSYFNFSLDLPLDWYVPDQGEIREMQQAGVTAIPNEALRQEILKADEVKDATLLMAYSYKPGIQEGFNPSFQVAVENISKRPEVRDGAQYLAKLTEMLKVSGMSYFGLDEPVAGKDIAGIRFDYISLKSDYMGYDITQDYYATIRDGFVLCFIATYVDRQQWQTIQDVLGSIVFK